MGKITLTNIVEELAIRSGLDKETADSFVRAFVATIEKGLDADHLVKVKGLGTFKLMDMNDRSSVDVNSGERITIKGYTKVSFTPDSNMKEFINRPFAHFEPTELNEGYPDEEVVEELVDTQAESEEHPDTPQDVSEETIETTFELVAEEPTKEVVQEPTEQEEEAVVEETFEPVAEEPVTEEPVSEEADADALATDIPLGQPAEEALADNAPAEAEQEEQDVQPASEASPQSERPRRGGWLIALLLIALVGGAYYYISSDGVGGLSSDECVGELDHIAETPKLGEELGAEFGDTLAEDSTFTSVDSSQVALDSVSAVEPIDTAEVLTSTIVEDEAQPSPTPEVQRQKPALSVTPGTFVIVESLASKNLKNITVADTTDYIITGTQGTHKLRDGETIIMLARKYYGDKRLWPYIVKHNNIVSFNKVRIGMSVSIPILQPAK